MTGKRLVQQFLTSGGARIFCLPLEIFPNFFGCAYLVLDGEHRILIDTGSGNDRSNECLVDGFRQVSEAIGKQLQPGDLTHVLITHGHIDHYGGLVFLRQHSNARLGVHELDRKTLTHHEERLLIMNTRLDEFLVEAGLDPETRQQMLTMYRFTKAIYQSGPVDFTYETQGMRVGPLDMIHIPGHCPGHVAIRLHDVVFSGDHVLEGMITHQSPEQLIPYMGLGHYLTSLSLLEHWATGTSLILAGHGQPIRDLPGRVVAVRKAIQGKINQVLDFLFEPHTTAEVTAHLYAGQAGYNALLVIEKTGAYIEYLYQRGLLEITNLESLNNTGRPEPLRYRRLEDASYVELDQKERAHVLI